MSTATESTNKARLLSTGRAAFLLAVLALLLPAYAYAAGNLCAPNPQIDLGDQPVGSGTTKQFLVFNCGNSTVVLNGLESDPHSGAGFGFSTSCTAGLALPSSASCTVNVTFAPASIGQASAGIREVGRFDDIIVFYGRGVDPRAGTASIVFTPAQLTFDTQRIGTLSAPQTVTVTNTGSATLTFSAALLNGLDPDDFPVGPGTTCGIGVSIAPDASCSITFYFQPLAAGLRTAHLDFDAPQLASLAILSLSGKGSNDGVLDVIEYYNALFDRYFITSFGPEIDALDAGLIAGWTRTGRHFAAYPPGTGGANPVCRFYLPPALGNAHFFSASPEECAFVRAIFAGSIEESAEVMDLHVPDPDTGACPATTDVPIYRVWNRGAGSDHRYITDRDLRDALVAKGWVAEGYGRDFVMMCSPGF